MWPRAENSSVGNHIIIKVQVPWGGISFNESFTIWGLGITNVRILWMINKRRDSRGKLINLGRDLPLFSGKSGTTVLASGILNCG